MTILCEPNASAAATVAPVLDGVVRTVANLADAARGIAADPDEHLVVIGGDVAIDLVTSFATELRSERPDVALVLLRDGDAHSEVLAATQAGVREVVCVGNARALSDACARARATGPIPQASAPTAPEPQVRRPGQVITVFSAKGGTGKTTVATNLAASLAETGNQRVCLMDLDLAFGDVAISMQLTPTRTLIDAVGVARGEWDDVRVGALLTEWRPDLDCILAPVEPGDSEKVPAGLVRDLLEELRKRYDFVVIDTPSQFSEHVLEALDASQRYLLLTTPEIPALKNLRLTLDMLDLLGYRAGARAVVLNRCDTRGGLSSSDIADTLKSPVAVHVPFSPDVPASINRGVPLATLQPRHPVSRAISDFATQSLLGLPAAPTARRLLFHGMKRTRSA